ncbi:MAG: dehypoxanthine futalosine cyclase [Candidatus Riflebacteria bacterium]|nr:dehypoxanthine futalosine cyclase [Candidatus Riflebacteria bacterium]
MIDNIRKKLNAGKRLSPKEGLYLLVEAPLDDLSEMAFLDKKRRSGNHVTFVLDTNPNYTNLCDCHCSFCFFYRKHGDEDAFILTKEQVVERVGKAVNAGATTVLMQGGCHPGLPVEYYFDMVTELRQAFPEVHLHLFSPPEIISIAKSGKLTVRAVLQKLQALGLKSLPGGGAEILVEKVRQAVSPGKCSAADWLNVMKEAHLLGLKTTATMVYGLGETDQDEITHLATIRDLQDETGGFTAFVPWSFKPGKNSVTSTNTVIPGVKYLRILATARLFLDNFPHIQASWFSEGKRTGQLGLLFGADDFGGTLFEEHVLKTAGHDVRSGVEEVKALIRGAGMIPVRRNTLYQELEVCTV